MTFFKTDEQTLGDLRIFGQGGDDSLYQLFNRTSTRGGAAELEDWFRHPMTDVSAINKRSELIRYFYEAGTAFPFTPERFEQAELYLRNQDERSRLSPMEPGLQEKIAGLVSGDNAYKTIYNGVTALLDLWWTLREFAETHLGAVARPMVGEEVDVLLGREAFQFLPQRRIKEKLTYTKVVELDTVLRFRHQRTVRDLLRYIYKLDTLISAANVARTREWVFATALPAETQGLQIEGLYHPMLSGAVPNDVKILPGHNVIFLTGANMAGKSTLMRSLGIAVFLAQMGLPVPARRMSFAVRDGLFTTINLPDNLGMGISHFYAEVLRIKKIAVELSEGRNLLVIVDELFRGTNVKDAYEATVALTGVFAAKHRSMFVISTHIIEAGDELKERHDNISFLYLPTIMEGEKPTYTYRLEQGITADRHGMVIINNEGIPAMLKRGLAGSVGKNSAGAQPFQTDEQTWADLNLMGKYRRESVFSLFNRVRTRGGEDLLGQYFRYPITDAELLNQKADMYRYFQDDVYAFPFGADQVDLFEEYLGQAVEGSRLLSLSRVLQRRVQAALLRDERYGVKLRGVRNALGFLESCRTFATQYKDKALPVLLAPAFDEFTRILGDARLASLPEWKEGDVISWQRIARIDYLLTVEMKEEMETLCRVLYEFDVCLSVGETAREQGFCFARALPMQHRVFRAAGLRHPSIRNAVGNAVSLNGESNLLFLTGANMAGKSTLMKSVGIAVYLAHMGFPVAADQMVFSVKEGLYSSINVSDNLELGMSHFYAEVLRVKKVAEAVSQGKSLFVIFDELFKGTNVKDAFDATFSVTESFAGYANCFFIISTHITEVGDLLKERRGGLQFYYLPTLMDGARPGYTYRLEQGISTDRHGMVIIRQENILNTISGETKPAN